MIHLSECANENCQEDLLWADELICCNDELDAYRSEKTPISEREALHYCCETCYIDDKEKRELDYTTYKERLERTNK